jgi:hypothetical protein
MELANIDRLRVNKKYNRILLSNVWDYFSPEDFIEIIKTIQTNLLDDNGKMQLCYFYTEKDITRFEIYKDELMASGIDMSLIECWKLDAEESYDASEFPKNTLFVLRKDTDVTMEN